MDTSLGGVQELIAKYFTKMTTKIHENQKSKAAEIREVLHYPKEMRKSESTSFWFRLFGNMESMWSSHEIGDFIKEFGSFKQYKSDLEFSKGFTLWDTTFVTPLICGLPARIDMKAPVVLALRGHVQGSSLRNMKAAASLKPL